MIIISVFTFIKYNLYQVLFRQSLLGLIIALTPAPCIARSIEAELSIVHAFPNQNHEQDIRLETMVVTGTRTPKLLEDSPVPISIITEKEIEMVSTGTISDVLALTPGISLQTNEKEGLNVCMQGFDGVLAQT